MNKDQWTVTGLILLLALLEVGRSKTVRSWFKSLYSDFQSAIGGNVPMVPGTPSISKSNTAKCLPVEVDSKGGIHCPQGYKFNAAKHQCCQ